MVGVWEGLNLGSIPNFFPCFGIHPKIIDVHPKLIPKGGVIQFCPKCSKKKLPRESMVLLNKVVVAEMQGSGGTDVFYSAGLSNSLQHYSQQSKVTIATKKDFDVQLKKGVA